MANFENLSISVSSFFFLIFRKLSLLTSMESSRPELFNDEVIYTFTFKNKLRSSPL